MPEVWFPNLGIEISKLSNVAIKIFGIDIYWYGVIIGLGILSGMALVFNEVSRTGQNADDYMDFTLFAIIACVIGARIYYVVFSWDSYKDNLWDIFNLREGGLAIYGGIITAVICALLYTRYKRMNFWLFADTAAPSLLLGQIIGRWGNFFNREAFGGYTDGLFAMRYIKDQVANVAPSILEKTITVNGVEYIQVQPTFLYESFWNLCVFIILMILKRKKVFDGEIFGLYILGYALGRVWIEGLRTDQLLISGTNIAVSQVLSGVLIFVGIGILVYRYKKQKTF